jgi:hypothetical protein
MVCDIDLHPCPPCIWQMPYHQAHKIAFGYTLVPVRYLCHVRSYLSHLRCGAVRIQDELPIVAIVCSPVNTSMNAALLVFKNAKMAESECSHREMPSQPRRFRFCPTAAENQY